MEWVWLCGGCIASPMQEVRLAVVWAVLYSDIFECVPSLAMWVLCVKMWDGQHLSWEINM